MVLSFPLVGEDHPLRQHATGILFKSALLSMLLHALFAGGRIYVAQPISTQTLNSKAAMSFPLILQPVPDFDPVPSVLCKTSCSRGLHSGRDSRAGPLRSRSSSIAVSSSGPSDPSHGVEEVGGDSDGFPPAFRGRSCRHFHRLRRSPPRRDSTQAHFHSRAGISAGGARCRSGRERRLAREGQHERASR